MPTQRPHLTRLAAIGCATALALVGSVGVAHAEGEGGLAFEFDLDLPAGSSGPDGAGPGALDALLPGLVGSLPGAGSDAPAAGSDVVAGADGAEGGAGAAGSSGAGDLPGGAGPGGSLGILDGVAAGSDAPDPTGQDPDAGAGGEAGAGAEAGGTPLAVGDEGDAAPGPDLDGAGSLAAVLPLVSQVDEGDGPAGAMLAPLTGAPPPLPPLR